MAKSDKLNQVLIIFDIAYDYQHVSEAIAFGLKVEEW